MEPKEILTKALAAVEEAGVPDDLRELAFAKAMDMYAGKAQPSPSGGGLREGAGDAAEEQQPDREPDAKGRDPLSKVASFYKIPRSEIENYFSEDAEGELTFDGDPRPLGKNLTEQARSVCLLLACARQVAGYDSQGTLRTVLRAACDNLGIVDSNFSKLFENKKEWFTVTGSRSSAVVKVKPDGRTAAEDKMQELRSR